MVRLVLIALIFLLSACTTLPAARPPLNRPMTWQARQATLQPVTHWSLSGKTAVRTPKDSISASLYWQQTDKKSYEIRLYGPLGAGAIKIVGRPEHVMLTTSHNQKRSATTPEDLMVQELGWSLPISNLFYWVRGLPSQGIPHTKHLDRYNHLQQLKQQGWTINYLRYTNAQGVDLPSKIFMENNDTSIKLIISQWQWH